MSGGDPQVKGNISADASFAPGCDRSRTGVVIRVVGALVHWASNTQSGSVMSAHEAELNGAVTGTKVGIAIRNLVRESYDNEAAMKLDQDNQSTISSIIHDVTSWRTRHYALRAAGIRYLIVAEKSEVDHARWVRDHCGPLDDSPGEEQFGGVV